MATAPIRPLAWEPAYAVEAALEKTKKKRETERDRELGAGWDTKHAFGDQAGGVGKTIGDVSWPRARGSSAHTIPSGDSYFYQSS